MTYFQEDAIAIHDDDDGTPVKDAVVVERARDGVAGEYIKLRWGPQPQDSDPRCGAFCYWLKLALGSLCFAIFALVAFKWIGPFFIQKAIIPMIDWERSTFSSPELAIWVFASVALFPTLLLPSSPSMWLAGMTFGYGFGFLLIISAAAVGVSLPFFIGSMFHHKIEGWLEKYPKKASVLRSAGAGNWFHQFKAVALIRVSPFPYLIYNYCAVATRVSYGPYLLGSLVGMAPEIFASIYTGILIRTLAHASHKKQTLSASQIAFNVAGFCVTLATIVFFTVYAKRRLKEIQKEDKLLLK